MTTMTPAKLTHGSAPAVGDALPELLVRPSHAHLFMFSAATWNRHHIHYSKDAAISEGHADVVVHRALLGNYLARMISDLAQADTFVRRVKWKVSSSAVPGDTLRATGEVVAAQALGDRTVLTCDVRISSNDTVVASGSVEFSVGGAR